MRFIKTFRVRVCRGDGKPVEAEIEARDGLAAQDLARAKFPGARLVHILGYAAEPRPIIDPRPKVRHKPVPPPVAMPMEEDPNTPEEVRECLRLHQKGVGRFAIASQLGVDKPTVDSWLRLYASDSKHLLQNDKSFTGLQNW